ncbi:hypothetical protein L6452_19681 [Arctium lappa]|uniref:Uncharacterized protein n=1 Tax=Arctium lappa TaxID=4217 RepID=A0ACB9B9T3_ARCLA|nr:hypothetical protein L6452_19681 [Arctium lappa]
MNDEGVVESKGKVLVDGTSLPANVTDGATFVGFPSLTSRLQLRPPYIKCNINPKKQVTKREKSTIVEDREEKVTGGKEEKFAGGKEDSRRRQLLIAGDREDVAFGCQSVGKETHGLWGKEGGADEEEDWCRLWHAGHQTEGCRSQTTV